jgi:hypothetical protein
MPRYNDDCRGTPTKCQKLEQLRNELGQKDYNRNMILNLKTDETAVVIRCKGSGMMNRDSRLCLCLVGSWSIGFSSENPRTAQQLYDHRGKFE